MADTYSRKQVWVYLDLSKSPAQVDKVRIACGVPEPPHPPSYIREGYWLAMPITYHKYKALQDDPLSPQVCNPYWIPNIVYDPVDPESPTRQIVETKFSLNDHGLGQDGTWQVKMRVWGVVEPRFAFIPEQPTQFILGTGNWVPIPMLYEFDVHWRYKRFNDIIRRMYVIRRGQMFSYEWLMHELPPLYWESDGDPPIWEPRYFYREYPTGGEPSGPGKHGHPQPFVPEWWSAEVAYRDDPNNRYTPPGCAAPRGWFLIYPLQLLPDALLLNPDAIPEFVASGGWNLYTLRVEDRDTGQVEQVWTLNTAAMSGASPYKGFRCVISDHQYLITLPRRNENCTFSDMYNLGSITVVDLILTMTVQGGNKDIVLRGDTSDSASAPVWPWMVSQTFSHAYRLQYQYMHQRESAWAWLIDDWLSDECPWLFPIASDFLWPRLIQPDGGVADNQWYHTYMIDEVGYSWAIALQNLAGDPESCYDAVDDEPLLVGADAYRDIFQYIGVLEESIQCTRLT